MLDDVTELFLVHGEDSCDSCPDEFLSKQHLLLTLWKKSRSLIICSVLRRWTFRGHPGNSGWSWDGQRWCHSEFKPLETTLLSLVTLHQQQHHHLLSASLRFDKVKFIFRFQTKVHYLVDQFKVLNQSMPSSDCSFKLPNVIKTNPRNRNKIHTVDSRGQQADFVLFIWQMLITGECHNVFILSQIQSCQDQFSPFMIRPDQISPIHDTWLVQ